MSVLSWHGPLSGVSRNSVSTLSHRSEVTETCPGRENQRILDMLTKEHPKQHGPRECLGEKALHGPITAAWARPAGDAQHRHASRHDHQSRNNTAALTESCSRHSGLEALQKC